MATHRAVHVRSAGAPLELVDVDTASPGTGQVRLAVAACGVCGTDHAFVNGAFPGLSWPITPGHEIAGTVAEIGGGVLGVEVGERVVVGWFGGNCGHCARCRAGQLIHCLNGQISAGSGTSAFSSPGPWASRPWPWPGARRRRPTPSSWARTTTSTPPPAT